MLKLLKNFQKKSSKPIIIISGLPRSGTSMMAKMLEAGGMEVLVDNIREANEDNPNGYYEFERVKKLPEGDTAWLAETHDNAVKVISALLKYLPNEYSYKILFMRRDVNEIIASQNKMLENRNKVPSKVEDEELARMFNRHLIQIFDWLDQQPNIQYINVNYNQILHDPLPIINEIAQFLNVSLRVEEMAKIVTPSLYRQRQ